MSIIDRAVDWYLTKYRTARTAPRYIGAEVSLSDYNVPQEWFADWTLEKRQKAAARLSWVFSNIVKKGNGVASAKFSVTKKGSDKTVDIDHPFERIMARPNPFMDGHTLIKYLIWALDLDDQGAFWYLAPKPGTNELAEIWPIMIGRMRPLRDPNHFIKAYEYTANNGDKLIFRKEFICRFIYPDPFDPWLSWPPLNSAGLPISIYEGVATAQRDMFTESRGAPLSVLSLDANISDPDFARARQRIRDDWADQRRIAVVRAGTLDVATVGLSHRDLEVIASSEFTRDEIDAVFMNGIMWRKNTATGEREELNKEIVENVYYPLHKQIAGQIQVSIIDPFYGEEWEGDFEDVRAQDRAIRLQEDQFYFRTMTIDEARKARGLPVFKWSGFTPPDKKKSNDGDEEGEDEEEKSPKPFEDYGSLPFSLANTPAFVTAYYSLGKGAKDPGKKPPGIGNLTDLRAPKGTVNELSGVEDDTTDEQRPGAPLPKAKEGDQKFIEQWQEAILEGWTTELKRYRTVAKRHLKSGKNLADLDFQTAILPGHIMKNIEYSLPNAETDDDVNTIFDAWLH